MTIVAAFRRLAGAATVFFGPHGAVSALAHQRGSSRQRLYREAEVSLADLSGDAAAARQADVQQQRDALAQRVQELEKALAQAVVIDRDRQAHFACRAQAEGVSLAVARRLLGVLLECRTPSVAKLGRFARHGARRSQAVLALLDPLSRARVQQAAADEIFVGRQPILMVVEQNSLCWVNGRRVERRDGLTWAAEFRLLPALAQVSADAGTGLAKGLALSNAERAAQAQGPVADQRDHFHLLLEGTWALRKMQGQAARAMAHAEKAERAWARRQVQGLNCSGWATAARQAWTQAEAAFARWSAAEAAWQQFAQALPLFTPEGELMTRARAEAAVAVVLPQLPGEAWAKVRRFLAQPELFTFLDQVAEQLAALPVAAELRQAALDREGLRRRPECLRGAEPAAAAARGLALVTGVLLAAAGTAGAEAVAAVGKVLAQAWRASSLVEGVNSVLRMQQARHRRLSQGLLDLKRLYWNCREFRTGKRKGETPYGRLGLKLPTLDWWALLKLPPEELRQQLSAQGLVA